MKEDKKDESIETSKKEHSQEPLSDEDPTIKLDDNKEVPVHDGEEIQIDSEDDIGDGESKKTSAFDRESLEDQASVITQIMIPVCITMLLVLMIVKTINTSMTSAFSASLAYRESASDTGVEKFFGSLLNALIFVGMILLVTVIFVVLYKYRCLKIIFGWLILSTCLMLGAFGGYLLFQITDSLDFTFDWITFGFIIWNFAVVGILSIFWHAPVKVNQGYLIIISTILAVIFTRLPAWTTWAVLIAIAIYDLFAVLCPGGPLRVLVETAQQRDEPIPALIYNASIIMTMAKEQSSEEAPQGRGVKLGLGDFVFYSVLVGRAALTDMITVFTAIIGIVTGLFCTILLLALWRKALPALPISIALGFFFYLITSTFLLPFVLTTVSAGIIV
jgi:hypothetical protein